MSKYKGKPGLGIARIHIISPDYAILVRNPLFLYLPWRLPGGHIKIEDGKGRNGIIVAAIRETEEETGIVLSPKEVTFVSEELELGVSYYEPNYCIAQISEEKLREQLKEIGDENGKKIEPKIVARAGILNIPNILEEDLSFIRMIEGR